MDQGGTTMERFWLKNYPAGVPADVDVSQYSSLVQLMDESFAKYAARDAYAFMDRHYTFADIDRYSSAFGAWLQQRGLAPGARVAIMMPNVIQYPIAVAAILRAGCVVVNVNPLYTPRELEHQLKDSGAEAIVILENFCTTLQQVIARTQVKHVIVASIGEMLGFPKSIIVNLVLRRVKKVVPEFSLPGHVRFVEALDQGARGKLAPVKLGPSDIAFLQYTGGTTDAPQPGRERAAARSLDAAVAERREPWTGARTVRLRLCAAALPRVRADRELPWRHATGRAQCADREPTRP
jgi:long-chain acyl-CoA synthetase